jgi:tRNA A37 methylthiotransferase MiaB
MKKVFVKTHGCQMNEYDSARMQDLLVDSHGMQPTDREEDADVILLNTCSIREKAQEKVFHQLGRWKPLKQKNPDLIIGVGGCVASQEGAEIGKRAPFVDLVFGPQTLHRLPEMIDERRAGTPRRRHQLPGDREVRSSAGAQRRGPDRLRLGHGGLQQVLQLLRGALHPRRGGLAPAG